MSNRHQTFFTCSTHILPKLAKYHVISASRTRFMDRWILCFGYRRYIGRYMMMMIYHLFITSKYQLLRKLETWSWARWIACCPNCVIGYKISLTFKVIWGHRGQTERSTKGQNESSPIFPRSEHKWSMYLFFKGGPLSSSSWCSLLVKTSVGATMHEITAI